MLKRITHPFLLPALISIIPLFWYALITIYGDLQIISSSLVIVEAILIGIQALIWYLVLQKRRGTPKIFKNVLNATEAFKVLLTISLAFLIILFISDYLVLHTILNEKNVSMVDQSKSPLQKLRLNDAFIWLFFANLISLMFLIYAPDHKYGQSFAYFRTIELEKTEFRKIWRFQKGIRLYDEYLAYAFDIRIKNMDQVQSSIIFHNSADRDNDVLKLIENFTDDKLEPARFLARISQISPEEFFHKQTELEHFEKYFKIISPMIPIIALIVSIIQGYHQ